MLRVKNWEKFQHYKDRCPPWIKLQTDIFQNLEFTRLQAASKLLALCIWTLASRSKDGTVEDDFDYIVQWGFLSGQVDKKNLQELIDKGFILRDSVVLAGCSQVAIPETEERRDRGRAETDSLFEELWSSWPNHAGGKAAALTKFNSSTRGFDKRLIVDRAIEQSEIWAREGKEKKYIPHLQTWLNQKRFDTDPESPNGSSRLKQLKDLDGNVLAERLI